MRSFWFLPALLIATESVAQTSFDGVARILRASPAPSAGYVRFNFPRRDLTVRIGALTVAPALALTTWAGFAGDSADGDVMGDIVTVAGELKGVLAECARQSIDVMAIHNHLAGEVPALTYVHYHAHGAAEALATRLDRVLARTGVPRGAATAAPGAPLAIDTGLVFGTLGQSGRAQGAMAQVSLVLVPGPVTMDGRILPPALAYASPINVQMAGTNRVVATGDFAVPGDKVQPVLHALATSGISATALHTHLVGESPQVYFIHFWADGAPRTVLAGLRRAIDAAR